MLKQKFKAVIAIALSTLGLKELPKGDDGKLALNADQEASLKNVYTGEKYNAFLKVANDILAEEAGLMAADQAEKDEANALLASVLKGNAGGEDDGEGSAPAQQATTPAPTTPVQTAQQVVNMVQDQQAQIHALMNQPEAAPQAGRSIARNIAGVALAAALSSSTHLFASNPQANNKIFAFEGRNWNQRAAGKSAAKTDFTDVSTIKRLNDDLREFHVQNPDYIRSLYMETYGFPTFWPKRLGVLDQISDAVFELGSVTQARKPDWTPGLEMWIEAEKRRIYRIQIDLEFDGYQLQELETSWLNSIFNFDGSSPYKHSFIAWLLQEVSKKARQEDAEGGINGIYAPNVAGIKTKGHFLNAQSGLRHQLYMFRDVMKKIAPHSSPLGKFSSANAYEYAKGMIESTPLAIRNKLGMKFYMAPTNIIKIQDNYKSINAQNNDYSGNKINYIDGYPNIEFVGLKQLEGSNLMFITDEKNIEILEYLPAEKEKYRIEELKRDSYIHADYRFGVAFVFSGFNLPANSSFRGVAQYIWVNDEPIFPATVAVPLFGKAMSAPVTLNYNRLYVHPELVSDVTVLEGLPAGTIVEITGNQQMVSTALIKNKTVPNGGNLDLTADFNPKTMYKLILAVQANGTYKELSRTAAFPSGVPAVTTFDDLVADYGEGAVQKYEGTAGTLTEIVGGNEGAELTLYGNTGAALTVATVAGKIVMTSSAVLDADAKFVTLKQFGGVWYDIARG